MKEAVADRRKSKTEGSLLIDKLIGSGNSEAAIVADAITYFVAGFHTTGLSKCNRIRSGADPGGQNPPLLGDPQTS